MKILINRTDAIGDALLTSGMGKLIKNKYPSAKIIFLITEKSEDVFKNHPYVDEFRVYHRNVRFYLKIREILKIFREIKPTHYFYAGGGYLPNFVAWITRVPFRGGHKSRWHTFLFLNKGTRQKRSLVSMHEMEYNFNLLAPMGIDYSYLDKFKYSPDIALTSEEISIGIEQFHLDLKEAGITPGRKMIFIHPGMTRYTLNWSSRNYGRLILKLEQKFPEKFLFIISHTPNDQSYLHGINEILGQKKNEFLKERIFYFNGIKNGLRQYMTVLSQASLFVGPSTGTTHIAAALGVPVVGLYSPIKVQSALRWGPVSKNTDTTKILVPDVICGEIKKCSERACPYYECMAKIEVEDVVKQATGIMEL